MKYLKRIILILVSALLLLAATATGIAVMYEEEIKTYVVKELNKNLDAEIKVGDISLSLIRKFPYASLQFSEVLAKDAIKKGQKDTLLYCKNIYLLFNMFDIFQKKYSIRKIVVNRGEINLKIYADGTDNFHFWKPSKGTGGEALSFNLENVLFENTRVNYFSKSARQDYAFFIHKGALSGHFAHEKFQLQSLLDLNIEHLQTGGITYFSHTPLVIETKLQVDTKRGVYKFEKTTLQLAALTLKIKGVITSANDALHLNLYALSEKAVIKNVIPLMPHAISAYLEDFETSGQIECNAELKGILSPAQNPLISLRFSVTNGRMLPLKGTIPFDQILLTGSYKNRKDKTSSTDVLNVENFSGVIGKKPVHGMLRIENFSDPYVSAKFNAGFALENLKYFFRTDTIEKITGEAFLQASLEGRYKNLASVAENFSASGSLVIHDMHVTLKKNPLAFRNINGSFQLQGKDLEVSDFSGNISSSGFQIRGHMENILPFLLHKEQPLGIRASFYAPMINLDELLHSGESSEVYYLGFSPLLTTNLSVNIDTLRFRNFSAMHIRGNVDIAHQVLQAHAVQMQTMDGNIVADGSIDASQGDSILIACDASIRNLNVNKLFYQCENFGQSVMEDKNIRGRLTADVQFVSVWSRSLEADLNSVYSKAKIAIEDGELIDFEPMQALSKFVKLSELKHIKFSTLENTIEIQHQKIHFPSMEIRSNALSLSLSGTHTFDNETDYHIKLLLSSLLGKKAKAQNTEFGEVEEDGLGKVTLYLSMKGPADDPRFSYDRKGVAQKIKEDIHTEKQTLKNILRNEFGWFKKDSTHTTKPQEEKQTQEKIEIDWDSSNDNPQHPENQPPSSTEQRRKAAIQKLYNEQ